MMTKNYAGIEEILRELSSSAQKGGVKEDGKTD